MFSYSQHHYLGIIYIRGLFVHLDFFVLCIFVRRNVGFFNIIGGSFNGSLFNIPFVRYIQLADNLVLVDTCKLKEFDYYHRIKKIHKLISKSYFTLVSNIQRWELLPKCQIRVKYYRLSNSSCLILENQTLKTFQGESLFLLAFAVVPVILQKLLLVAK